MGRQPVHVHPGYINRYGVHDRHAGHHQHRDVPDRKVLDGRGRDIDYMCQRADCVLDVVLTNN